MRPASAPAGLALLLALASPLAAAEQAPDVRVVVVPEAQVRCAPSTSPTVYPTNRLRQGERVEVVEEYKDSGWLAIRPPRGSFSWINVSYLNEVTPHHTNYVVAPEDVSVPVYIGSAYISNQRPTVRGAQLKRGHQVRGLGPPQADADGRWLPIEPPAGEVRYIRAEAVAKVPAPVTHTTVAASGGPPPAPTPPPDGDALWRQAQQAERTGRLTEAIRLYDLAAEANLPVNHARAEAALRRAEWLRQAGNTPAPAGGATTAGYDARTYPLPSNPAGQTTAAQLISPAGSSYPAGQLVSMPGAAPGGWGLPSAPAAAVSSVHSGRLYRASRGAPFLLMHPEKGSPILYVAGQDGLDLGPFVDRNVELSGPISYRNDLRAYFMTVTRVQPLQ